MPPSQSDPEMRLKTTSLNYLSVRQNQDIKRKQSLDCCLGWFVLKQKTS